eukprot:6698882-Prymnesium_polylepis.1
MSGSPEARVAPEASGISESSRSRQLRRTRSRPIHCYGRLRHARPAWLRPALPLQDHARADRPGHQG